MTTTNGTTSINSHKGCVHTCSRLIADTPWVTSGITTKAQIRYPQCGAMPSASSSA